MFSKKALAEGEKEKAGERPGMERRRVVTVPEGRREIGMDLLEPFGRALDASL